MKQIHAFSTTLMLIMISLTTLGQIADTNFQNTNNVYQDSSNNTITTEEKFKSDEPMDLFLLIVLFIIFCVAIGIGVTLTFLALSIVFGLVAFGVLSTSIIVGLNKKSFEKGFKTLIILSSTIFGILLSLVLFWFQNKIQHWWSMQTALISGFIFGALSGFLVGKLAVYILKRMTGYFKLKLKL